MLQLLFFLFFTLRSLQSLRLKFGLVRSKVNKVLVPVRADALVVIDGGVQRRYERLPVF